jgi:hypothetical protein
MRIVRRADRQRYGCSTQMLMSNRQELLGVVQKLRISSGGKFAERDLIQLRPQISVSQTLVSHCLNVRAKLHQVIIHRLQATMSTMKTWVPTDLVRGLKAHRPSPATGSTPGLNGDGPAQA